MKRSIFSLFILLLLLVPTSCRKILGLDNSSYGTTYYANQFAHDLMDAYYLWHDQVADEIKNWSYDTDPVAKVKSLRYKEYGKEIDRWTSLWEDVRPFLGSVTGNTDNSFGFDFLLKGDAETGRVDYGVVTYTYANSPASEAGICRGDIFTSLNGAPLDLNNYSVLYDGGTVRIGMQDGKTVSLTARKMYEDPIQTVRILEMGGKKIGYVHFTGFTLRAAVDFEDVFGRFKAAGIDELVMDLRYNGGGYTVTGLTLGTMMAPLDVVQSGSIFNKDVFNSNFDDSITRFEETIVVTLDDGTKHTVHAADVNPGVPRVWFITTGSSASASESLICGLKPFMKLYTVGQQTYGKYCGGYIITAEDYYNAVAKQGVYGLDASAGLEATENWGIYVIATRYSDCNGITLSMPDGIPADYAAADNPLDGYALGDPDESMLSAVLERMGVKPLPAVASRHAVPGCGEAPGTGTLLPVAKPGFGVRVLP